MAKLTSKTGKTSAIVSNGSIIFQSYHTRHQIFWPVRDWEILKQYVDGELGIKIQTTNHRIWICRIFDRIEEFIWRHFYTPPRPPMPPYISEGEK